MKKLLKSSFLNLHSYPKDNIPAYIRAGLELFKETGFEVANIGTPTFLPPDGKWQPVVEQALLDAKELNVPFVECHLPFFAELVDADPEYIEHCNRKMYTGIDIAKALGVERAVIHANAVPLASADDRATKYDRMMAYLTPFAEYAAKAGVNLMVENMRQELRYCREPEELCRVADALDFGVCWDFGHANITGIKQSEALAYIGKRLKCVHIHDNSGVVDDHLPPFVVRKGNVDWQDAMHGLALAEFEGPLNYEVVTINVPAETRKVFAQYLAIAADKLMEYIK